MVLDLVVVIFCGVNLDFGLYLWSIKFIFFFYNLFGLFSFYFFICILGIFLVFLLNVYGFIGIKVVVYFLMEWYVLYMKLNCLLFFFFNVIYNLDGDVKRIEFDFDFFGWLRIFVELFEVEMYRYLLLL